MAIAKMLADARKVEDGLDDLLTKAFEFAGENARMIPNDLFEDMDHWIDKHHMKSLVDKFKETL